MQVSHGGVNGPEKCSVSSAGPWGGSFETRGVNAKRDLGPVVASGIHHEGYREVG